MTKLEAIKKVMEDNGGTANWKIIYDNIEKYYHKERSRDWQAGIRGIVYRDLRETRNLKKIGIGVYALHEYEEEALPKKDKVRMHSFVEGVCMELGNLKNFLTYTADPSAPFKDNITLGDLATIQALPRFTYSQIVDEVKRIDVVWVNKTGFCFPQRVFEVVDSISTLTGAFNRSLQLLNFRTEYYIVAPEHHKEKYEKKINLAPYNANLDKFRFVSYNKIINYYEKMKETDTAEKEIFNF